MLLFTVIIIDILAGAEVDLFVPSFPELQKIFHLSPFLIQFMLSGNLVFYCLCSLFAGALGDRYNRRSVMLISLSVLLLGSILCVTAVYYPMLLVGRILQGIGMAGPAALAFPIALEYFSAQKQAAIVGILNGIANLSMAFAPVVGSYINLFFGWRGNFIVLLAMSAFCLVMSYFVLPNRQGNPAVSLSLKAYWPLLCSVKMQFFTAFFCFLASTYWVFIGMAPILYMHDLGVSLKEFGYYQGVLAATFGLISLVSPKFFTWFGKANCFYTGIALCIVSGLCAVGIICFNISQPLLITTVVVFMSIAAAVPVAILFPQALAVLEHSGGRASALMLASRLILTALTLIVVSYFYNGTFFPIGLAMVIFQFVAMFCVWKLLAEKWIVLS